MLTLSAEHYLVQRSSAVMIIVILCLLTGMALGQRFKVLVLVPAVLLVVALSIDFGGVRANFWPITFSAVAAVVGLEVGYLLGTGIATLVDGFRHNRANSLRGSSPTRQPVHDF